MPRCFEAECEVWVKPMLRKARPKRIASTWMAESYEQFLRMLQEHYEGKRWKLTAWNEVPVVHVSNPRMTSEVYLKD